MRSHSQLQKIISVFMISLLLIQLSGCYSYKVVPSSDLPLPNSSKFPCIIYGKNKVNGQKIEYQLENTVISNGILSGKVISTDTTFLFLTGKRIIKLYLSSDTVMKINPENNISVPLDSVTKVEMKKYNSVESIFAAGVIVLVLIVTWAALQNTNIIGM